MFTPEALISEKHENTNEQRKLVSGFPITAIVVEHETISRVILAAVLSCDGYRVFQTDNPITAISYFRTNDPAVLIVDLDMPEWTYIVQFALDRRPNTFVIGMVENNPMPDVFSISIDAESGFVGKNQCCTIICDERSATMSTDDV